MYPVYPVTKEALCRAVPAGLSSSRACSALGAVLETHAKEEGRGGRSAWNLDEHRSF